MKVNVKCVHCGAPVKEFANECPQCGKPVANPDAPVNVSPPPWKKQAVNYGKKFPVVPVLAAGAAIAAALVWFLVTR